MKKTSLNIKELDPKWAAKMDELIKKYTISLQAGVKSEIEKKTIPVLAAYHAKIDLLQEKVVLTYEEIEQKKAMLANDISLPKYEIHDIESKINDLAQFAWDLETEIEAKKEFVAHFNKRLLLNF